MEAGGQGAVSRDQGLVARDQGLVARDQGLVARDALQGTCFSALLTSTALVQDAV